MTFPFHPAYGLPDSFRAAAVRAAQEHGAAAAAAAFNVARATIYRWRAAARKSEE